MMPASQWLVQCPHCSSFLWIDEQEQVGKINPGRLRDNEFKSASSYNTLSHGDYTALLSGDAIATASAGASSQKKERHLRLRAWWSGNDFRRLDDPDAPPMSDDEIRNLHAFVTLLNDTDDNDRIMKAEVMRELGLFAEATAILSEPFPEEFSKAVALIKGLAEQEIASVKEMIFTNAPPLP